MHPTDLLAWSAAVRRRFVEHRVTAGSMSASDAPQKVDAIIDGLLPAGPATPDHHLWSARLGSTDLGQVWLRVRNSGDVREAFLFDITAAPETWTGHGLDRALAATALVDAIEVQARALGAALLRVNVFGSDPVLRTVFGDRAGYRPAATQLILRLADRPETVQPRVPEVRLRPMSPAEFVAFRADQEVSYAAELTRSGTASATVARLRAESELAEWLPDGLDSAGQELLTAVDTDEQEVGYLWLQEEDDSAGQLFVLDLTVRADRRRHGFGRSLMLELEQRSRRNGVRAIRLSVFGFNRAARALYDRIGYEPTEELLVRSLAPPVTSPPRSVLG